MAVIRGGGLGTGCADWADTQKKIKRDEITSKKDENAARPRSCDSMSFRCGAYPSPPSVWCAMPLSLQACEFERASAMFVCVCMCLCVFVCVCIPRMARFRWEAVQ